MLHAEREELHGITVLVESTDGQFYIGRFHETIERGVVLLDVARHLPGPEAGSKDAWVERTLRFGVRVEERRVVVPTQEISTIVRLADWRPHPA